MITLGKSHSLPNERDGSLFCHYLFRLLLFLVYDLPSFMKSQHVGFHRTTWEWLKNWTFICAWLLPSTYCVCSSVFPWHIQCYWFCKWLLNIFMTHRFPSDGAKLPFDSIQKGSNSTAKSEFWFLHLPWIVKCMSKSLFCLYSGDTSWTQSSKRTESHCRRE